jgi:hypothetical protein
MDSNQLSISRQATVIPQYGRTRNEFAAEWSNTHFLRGSAALPGSDTTEWHFESKVVQVSKKSDVQICIISSVRMFSGISSGITAFPISQLLTIHCPLLVVSKWSVEFMPSGNFGQNSLNLVVSLTPHSSSRPCLSHNRCVVWWLRLVNMMVYDSYRAHVQNRCNNGPNNMGHSRCLKTVFPKLNEFCSSQGLSIILYPSP